MKKTLIALTLAALPVASMAEVVLYAQIKGGVEISKTNGLKGTTTKIVDYGSRLGFRGQEEFSNGLKAIWQLEQSVNIGGGSSGFGTRDSFIGLATPAGTVKVGYLSTPVKDINGRLDQWEYDNEAGGLGVFTRSNDAVGRKVAANYETPDLGGFKARVYVSPSNNQLKNGEVDNSRLKPDRPVYGVGLGYENNGFFAEAAGVYVKNHLLNDQTGNNTETKVGSWKGKNAYQAVAQVGYEKDNMLFGVAYQQARNVDGTRSYVQKIGDTVTTKTTGVVTRSQEVAASAAVNVDNALTLKGSAAYGFNIKEAGNGSISGQKVFGNGRYIQGIVGADYKLSKRTQLNGQVGYLQFGKKEYNARTGMVGVGLKHKF